MIIGGRVLAVALIIDPIAARAAIVTSIPFLTTLLPTVLGVAMLSGRNHPTPGSADRPLIKAGRSRSDDGATQALVERPSRFA